MAIRDEERSGSVQRGVEPKILCGAVDDGLVRLHALLGVTGLDYILVWCGVRIRKHRVEILHCRVYCLRRYVSQ